VERIASRQHPAADDRRARRARTAVLAAAAAGVTAIGVALPLGANASPADPSGASIAVGDQFQTVGSGDLEHPASGPGPSGPNAPTGFKLIKNWDFGTSGTIKSLGDMDKEFTYTDHWGTPDNGGNYGSKSLPFNASNKVRSFTGGSLKTFLVPLNGHTTVSAKAEDVGNGSFASKFAFPKGGSRLGHDILWETRVRYTTPRYFWFALWNAGKLWNKGAEFDVVESFGYDNGNGNTNYRGQYWHSDPVGGTSTTDYSNWASGMAKHGFKNFDATAYHTWSLLYKTDNTYTFSLDGVVVQSGRMEWTDGGGKSGTATDLNFLFDVGWGHKQVSSVNHSMPASELSGKSYEFDYSRVYER
jgi:hypothetical protein